MPLTQFRVTHRNLPHWHSPGVTYFLTWRVRGGLILEPEDRTIALDAIRYWDDKKWFVSAAVVMPDHVHVLVRPLPLLGTTDLAADDAAFYDLSGIIQSVKGYSAREINRRRGRSGALWQDETFDRIVRDESELEETREYVRGNPVRAELAEVPELYPWLYQTVRVDWTRPG